MASATAMSRRQRWFLFALVFAIWTTGLLWFALDRFVEVEGEFGPEKHPWQSTILKSHGAVGFLVMIAFGYVLASHVAAGWRVRRMRPLGMALLAALAFLIVTAYGLYYTGSETLRSLTSDSHTLVGAALPLLLVAHLVQGKRKRRRPTGVARSTLSRPPLPGGETQG